MGTKNVNTYTKKELSGFLVGMFGQNMIYQIVATGLYFYFQNVIFLDAMAIGVIFTIARIWDAINDPMMGTIVDKTRSKWGKCRPYLIIFPGIIGAITIAAFINDIYPDAKTELGRVLIVGWAAASYILWGMCFTVCDIPLWGITSLMTEDENDRSKILSLARIVAGFAGIGTLITMVAQFVAGIFENKLGYPYKTAMQYGFIATVVVLTVINSLLFEVAGLTTRERVEQTTEKKYSFIENFKIMFGNRPFRQILISGILRSPIQLLMLIAMTFITFYYANGNLANILADGKLNVSMLIRLGIIGFCFFMGQFICMAITPNLMKKFEKKSLYNFYSVAGAVPYALIYVLYKISGGNLRDSIFWVILTGICFFFASAAMGGINVLQSVMIADCVDYEEYHNGVRTDGVFFSGQSFITKLSGGIASILSAFAYKAVGYSDSNVEKMTSLLNEGKDFLTYDGGSGAGKYAATMVFLISIPPAIGMLLSAVPTFRYAMSDKEHEKILAALVEKRHTSEAEATEETPDENTQALIDNMDEIVDEIKQLD